MPNPFIHSLILLLSLTFLDFSVLAQGGNGSGVGKGKRNGKRHRNIQKELENISALKLEISTIQDDFQLSIKLNQLGLAYQDANQKDSALHFFNKALNLQKEIGDLRMMSTTLNNVGVLYKSNGEYKQSIDYFLKGIEIAEERKDTGLCAVLYNNIGKSYIGLGNYIPALKYTSKGLYIEEAVNDPIGIAVFLNNLASIHIDQGNYSKAIVYGERSVRLLDSIGRKRGLSSALDKLGEAYKEIGEIAKALESYQRSLQLRKEFGHQRGVAKGYNNMAAMYLRTGNYDSSLTYYLKSLNLFKDLGDQQGVAVSKIGLGKVYSELSQYQEVLKVGRGALDIALGIEANNETRDAAKLMWEAYRMAKNYVGALKMYELYIQYRDSINSQANQKELIRQEYEYEYEKQAIEDSIQLVELAKVQDAKLAAERAENKRHKLEAKQQEQQKYYLFGGLALALLFGGFIFSRFRVTQKQKGIIEEQKQKVDAAYDQLEEKNTEILDSINYAKRIQSAILPPHSVVKEYLTESFILYKPKDIVAGDFYWLESYAEASNSEGTEDLILFAACDCTGHGVPGAMVSVVCNNGLNRSVREHGLTEPGAILNKTREIVIKEFEKSEEEVKDGMDVALCSLSLSTLSLHFAGANNPLWIIRKGTSEVEEIKGNKMPIGKYAKETSFDTHEVSLQKGDSIYIFSDGFVDQFGGEKGKKFKPANFKKLLLSIQQEPMEQQRELIDEAFENWRGDLEQLDDVCVIGVRV